ncbi:hypothetical protein JMF89_13840 [Clostridiaceae bacterium UIB06]|nr:hypothetical protein [Clostridiaceae bacterium UIB06]
MKGFKKIIIWTLIPIMMELVGLLYIDQFYLNDETSFNATKVDVTSKKEPNKIKVKIPEEAKNIGVSYTGNYISYYQDGVIKVVDTSNNKEKELKVDGDAQISSYKWLADRDIMLIAEKYNGGGNSNYLKFESYNAKKDEKTVLSDDKNKQLKISLADDKYEVLDMALSSATNVTYVKVGKDGAKSRIYRINVMAQVEETKYVSSKLGKITAANKEDKLIYEDTTGNRIRVAGAKNPIATGENAIHYLLSTDSEDRVYIGNGENNKVKKIFIGSVKTGSQQWKTVNLSQQTSKNDIYITTSGKIYINNPSSNVIRELETGKETKYEGTLINVYNLGIISENKGKLIGNLF